MTWVRMDDQFWRNAKQLQMSDAAYRVWTCSWSYCAQSTDPTGFLSKQEAKSFLRFLGKSTRVIAELLARHAWEAVEDGYLVHDLDHYLDPGSRDRVRRWREKQKQNGATDVTLQTGYRPVTGNADNLLPRARVRPVPEPVTLGTSVPNSPPVGPPNEGAEVTAATVREVFDAWVATLPPGTERTLTAERARKIRTRLTDCELEDVLDAVRGWPHDPWDERPQQNDVTILLRTKGQVEKFRDLYRHGPTLPRPNGKSLADVADELEQHGGRFEDRLRLLPGEAR